MNNYTVDFLRAFAYNEINRRKEVFIMYSIGIDLGGTNIAIGLCDSGLNIIDRDSIPTNSQRGPFAITADMAHLTEKIITRNNISLGDLDFVGIASPGTIDSANGIVSAAYNIKMIDFPMVEEFKKILPIERVLIANDANAAALGEALMGAGKNTKSSVMITLGTGVGGGIVIDGKIFAGGLNPYGAEIGHMVIKHGGRECTCGRRGCFEAYSSATALISMTKEKIAELKDKKITSPLVDIAEKEGRVTGKTVFDARDSGDGYAGAVIDYYIEHLACGITNIINIFQPEVVEIGGGVCNQGDAILKPLREIADREQYTKTIKDKTKIVIATLKNDAGIIGAAALGR